MPPRALHPDDTIAALASAPGSALRGIIRISGRAARAAVESIFVPSVGSAPPAAFRADHGKPAPQSLPWCYAGILRIKALSHPLETDLYLWPGRRSYTGEPLAELHTIGSPPILEAVLAELFAGGVRPAHPGEFTLRAFLAGRIDLTQAEAVLGVIDAQNERELETALEQLAGGLSSRILWLRSDLMDLLADLEAGLDFADEPIEFVSHAALVGRLGLARERVAELLECSACRVRSAPRARVVLAGAPNAGKSTLFNALAGEQAALVSEIAGTTRDYLTVEVALEGATISLIDTAGWEERSGGIGAQAQSHRQEQLEQADLVVWCRPADELVESDAGGDVLSLSPERLLRIMTKCDLSANGSSARAELSVSAHRGTGLSELRSAIAGRLSAPAAGQRQLLGTTAARAQSSLQQAAAALDRALGLARDESGQELLSIEIRDALDALGDIAGAIYTDDLLDRIFSRFCIGK